MLTRIVSSAALLACFWSSARAETLSGVVLQQNGKPAPRATICVAAVFHHPPLRTNVTADEHGAFRIDLAQDGKYRLAVRWQTEGVDLTEGIDSKGDWAELSGQKLPPQIVRLRPNGSFCGKLLRAEDGGPIAGARLFFDTGEVPTTDQAGVFIVSGLPMKVHSLIPVAKGRVRLYVLFDTTMRENAELEVRLPRGALLKGRITSETGQPIPGAFLRRLSSGNDLTLNGWDEVCAADGSFEYSGLSTERLFYNLRATAPGYRDRDVATEVDNPATVIERTIRLQKDASQVSLANSAAKIAPEEPENSTTRTSTLPRRTLHGRVRDEDGAAIAGAKIRWAADVWDTSVQPITTDANGKYRLSGVPAGQGALLVIADLFAPQVVAVHAEQENLDVQLSRGISLSGRVRTVSGSPVAGVRVIPVTRHPETGFPYPIWLDERSTETNVFGQFQLAALPSNGVRCDFVKEGFSDRRDVELSKENIFNNIGLTGGEAISGNVVDAAGNPVRNFKVRVRIPRDDQTNEQVGKYNPGFDWYGITYSSRDSFFVPSGLGAEMWARPDREPFRLIVTSPAIGFAIVERAGPMRPDQRQEAVRPVRLKPFVPLSVRVVSASKSPVIKGTAALVEDRPYFTQGFSWGHDDLWSERRAIDRAGTAVFTEPACSYGTILVRAAGFARQRIEWTNRAREVTVALEAEAVIRGEVQFKGTRLERGYARLKSATKDSFAVDLEETAGRFNFEQLPADDYELIISRGGKDVLARRTFSLTPGKVQIENIAISENGSAN
jgi:hypothetical protein